MRIDLPAHSLYGDAPVTIEFPDSWDVQVASFQGENARTLTQEEIASSINISRAQVAKICSQFRKEGIVKTGNRSLIITDLEKLATYCRL